MGEHVASLHDVCGILCEWLLRVCYDATARSYLHEEAWILDKLCLKSLAELRSFTRPPLLVEVVLGNVQTILGLDPSWPGVRQSLQRGREYMERMRYFQQERLTADMLRTLHRSFRVCPDAFEPELVAEANKTCSQLCRWVNGVCQRAGVQRPQGFGRISAQADFLKRSRLRYVERHKVEQQEMQAQAQKFDLMHREGWRETQEPRSLSPSGGRSPTSDSSPRRGLMSRGQRSPPTTSSFSRELPKQVLAQVRGRISATLVGQDAEAKLRAKLTKLQGSVPGDAADARARVRTKVELWRRHGTSSGSTDLLQKQQEGDKSNFAKPGTLSCEEWAMALRKVFRIGEDVLPEPFIVSLFLYLGAEDDALPVENILSFAKQSSKDN